MKFQYCSDLHLEFAHNRYFLRQNPLKAAGEMLLLAGDIVPFAQIDSHADFFSWVSDNFVSAYWIPGNHEYYGIDAANRSGILHEKIRENVFLVNNVSIMVHHVRLLLTTLWSNISPRHENTIRQNVADFRRIRWRKETFTPEHFNILHETAFRFLQSGLKDENHKGKTIVVTHHVPTLLHYPEQYTDSPLTDAFAVDLYSFIRDSHVDRWIYGHHHVNTPAFLVGDTTMLTNQLGYVSLHEHAGFQTDRCIDI